MPSPARRNKITVLLCDDHAMVREGTRRLLEAEPDIEVVGEASDGIEAVEMAGKLSPQVIAMDVSMPRMNGVEATKRIKAEFPKVYVLALTAYDDFQYVTRLLENGASGYILKSARSEELVAAIRAASLGESILDGNIAREIFSRIARRAPSVGNGSEPAAAGGPSGSDGSRGECGTGRPLPDSGDPPAERTVGGRSPIDPSALTVRERAVLRLAASGLSNKEIAHRQGVSPRTVQSHLASVFSKLGVVSRTEAVVTALRRGIITEKEIGVPPGG